MSKGKDQKTRIFLDKLEYTTDHRNTNT